MQKRYLNKSNKVEVIVKLQGYIDKGKEIFHIIIIIIIIMIIIIMILIIIKKKTLRSHRKHLTLYKVA